LIALGELRALAAVHGPMALVLLDAHADTWDEYWGERYFHGTPFRRAVEEGLVLPERSLLAGMRGSLYERDDLKATRELGFDVIEWERLREMPAADYARAVRERVGDAP
jgi:agmatinase